MIDNLYILFGHYEYMSVIVRTGFTILFLSYLFSLINFNNLKFVTTLLFIPLIVSITGSAIICSFFDFTEYGCDKIKNKFKKQEDLLFKNISMYIQKIRTLYKLFILYVVIKFIKPEININLLFGSLLVYLYFFIYPFDTTYLDTNLEYNDFLLSTSMILFANLCVLIYYYGLKNMKKYDFIVNYMMVFFGMWILLG
jgi:hypothetical protein